ncbi:MAG: hypothetical protein HY609_02920 [Deltaproteobacteria bacterium]|nr:hypothetical protein [Deltaproteobacteria bacterium]MBI4223860.1 hypothetical protein [Deltaproteobacteria bacterium]
MRNLTSIAITLLSLWLWPAAGAAQEIHAPYQAVDGAFFSRPDPNAAVWQSIPETTVNLLPQNITQPSLFQTSVAQLKVKTLHNKKWLAVRLEWQDKTKDQAVSLDHASDACAIQFPVKEAEKTSPFMGNKGFPVAILHWKAIWQKDIEDHYQQVKDLYPNTYNETYRFGIQAAIDAKNPLSQPKRQTPVERLMAEGFGTLTTQAEQNASGWGIHTDGKWQVVLARPLQDKGKTSIAFALWEGGDKNAGAKKNYAPWVSLILEEK